MRLSLSRRIVSYFIDAMPIFTVVILMHSLFVGAIITNSIENYDQLAETYYANSDVLADQVAQLRTDLTNELITETQYEEQVSELNETFFEENQEEYAAVVANLLYTLTYGFVTYVLLYFAYMLILKGNSFGRRLMGGELTGKVRWYTIFAREVVWKHFFWILFFILITFLSGILYVPLLVVALFTISGITFDVALIGFSQQKSTLRDIMSQTQVTYKGAN